MKMEKLIRELGSILYALHDISSGLPKGRLIEEAITLIGRAVLSGECADLDKLLGVVERVDTRKIGGQLWIAFRPPETEPENEG